MKPIVLAVCLLLLGGCGSGTSTEPPAKLPATLAGDRVARMAETQLEAEHPSYPHGTMTCPDLPFEVGRQARCLRTVTLADGRVLRVYGTVAVTSREDNGRLHVRLDGELASYGVGGAWLANDLLNRVLRRYRARPDRVVCPDLAGGAGVSVRCAVWFGKEKVVSMVRVVGDDPSAQTIRYAFEPGLFDVRLNPALPSLLDRLRRDGLKP